MLRVRAHHKGLHHRLEDTFALDRAKRFAGSSHDYADTVGKGHGRIAFRRCRTTGDRPVAPGREGCHHRRQHLQRQPVKP